MPRYEIRVQGRLDPGWSNWLDRFSVIALPDDQALLVGRAPDQPALHSLLAKIRDLGLPLLSLECVEEGQPGATRTTRAGR